MITALGTGIGKDEYKPGETPLSPADHHDRRRRGRRAHPHAAADVLLPANAGAGRGRSTFTSPSRRSIRSSTARPSVISRTTRRSIAVHALAGARRSDVLFPKAGAQPDQFRLGARAYSAHEYLLAEAVINRLSHLIEPRRPARAGRFANLQDPSSTAKQAAAAGPVPRR